MFVGHEFTAFALAGMGATALGRDARTALLAGGVAALCALLPDLDVAYGLVVYLLAVTEGTALSWDAFWGVANGVHRVVTHPLPIGVAATLCLAGGAAVVRGRWDRSSRPVAPALVPLAAVVVAAVVVSKLAGVSGSSSALVAATYLATVAAVGAFVGSRTDASAGVLAAAAAVGFLTHPFGDVLMAAPPPLLAPFGDSPLTARVVFSPDDTVNLLVILFAEVATVWAGLLTYLHLTGRRLRDAFDGRAAVGVGYAPAVFVLPRPTMVDAHYLGFTVVPLAVVVGLTAFGGGVGSRRDRSVRGLATGLATLTVAAAAYLLTYLLA